MKRTPRRAGRPAPAAPQAPAPISSGPDLPPHSPELEKTILACVLAAGSAGSQAQVDALLAMLSPSIFYLEQHRDLFALFGQMRAQGSAVDTVTVTARLKAAGNPLAGDVFTWADSLPNWAGAETTFLPDLRDLATRRFLRAKAAEMSAAADAPTVSLDQVRERLGELLDGTAQATRRGAPLVEFLTPKQARDYVPDPSSYLVGEDMISRGDFAVLGGWQGLGKSMLAKNLAFAGARGGNWLGYQCRRKFRTLILQGEDNRKRLKREFDAAGPGVDEFVRCTPPIPLAFSNPSFRSEVRRFCDSWRPDLVIVDNWTDISAEQGNADAQEAFQHIRDSLPWGDEMPAVLILAHLRKQRGGESWRPKLGRELMHELSGSLALTSKARTVFVIQPLDAQDMENDGIVLCAAKSNNETPLPPKAWRRAMGACLPIPDFDLDEWANPPDDGPRKTMGEDAFRRLFDPPGSLVAEKILVQRIEEAGFSYPTARRYLTQRFAHLVEDAGKGLLRLKG